MRRAWALAPLVLLAACLDFVEVTGPPVQPQPASASFTVQVGEWTRPAAADSLFLMGYATPGRAEDGRPRVFADDAVRVAGMAVPSEVRPGEARSYVARMAVPAPVLAGGALEVRMPVLAGAPGPDPLYRLFLARPLDGDTVRIAAGQDLALRVSAPPADPAEVSAATWAVALRTAGGGQVGMNGEGPVPAVIRIPAEWLPAGSAAGLQAHLAVSQHLHRGNAESVYVTAVAFTQYLSWTVLIGG